MELHRCRFVNYQPATINALKFTPPTYKQTRLAVGRANGDIEIWDPSYKYRLEKTIPGGQGQSIESLVWAHQTIVTDPDLDNDDPNALENELKEQLDQPPRLFTSGLNSYIVEWDTQLLIAKKSVDSNGGAIWCLAVNSNGTRLAAGCEDGCVRIYDISDNQLEYIRSFEPQKGRILSIAWGPNDSYIVTGGANSNIHKWNVQLGRSVQRMTVDKHSKSKTMVWSIATTIHNTIISGDSLGNLMFWDSELGTLKQSLKAHSADILSLVASADGNLVFSAGVDQKIVVNKRVQAQKNKKKTSPGTWTTLGSRRYHWHDIRSLALDDRPEINSIVSGGVDVELVASPAKEFPRLQQNRITPFARRNIVSISKSHKLIMARFFSTISLWKLGKAGALDYATKGSIPEMYEPHEFLIELNLKDDCYITSASLSENAQWIATCDVENIRLFKLIRSKDDEEDELMDESGDDEEINHEEKQVWAVKKMRGLDLALASYFSKHNIAMGGHHVIFTPSSDKLVVVTVEMKIIVIDLSHWEQDEFEIVKTFDQHQNQSGEPNTVVNIAVSPDGQWLVTGDDKNQTFVFNLDSLKLHYTLPSSIVPETALSFNPFKPNELFIGYANNTFAIYDVEHKRQTKWSIKHRHQEDTRIHSFRDRIRGVAYNPASKDKMVVYGSTFMSQVDMSHQSSKNIAVNNTKDVKINNNKRKADQQEIEKTATNTQPPVFEESFSTAFQHILYCDFIDANSMVVVERRKESILEHLPPSFYFASFNK